MAKEGTVLVICGPTAVGKTKYAIIAAQHFDGEIVSCDSMQIYQHMDIGSAKPTAEELQAARHHLVDFADPGKPFSVAEYQKLAREAIDDILSRGKLPIVCGGTGLYLNSILYDMDFAKAGADSVYRQRLEETAEEQGTAVLHELLQSLDPAAAEEIHPNNKKRLIRALERLHQGEKQVTPFSRSVKEWDGHDFVLTGLTMDRQELYERIDKRVLQLVENGLAAEVRKLMNMGLTADDIAMKGIGYKEMIDYIEGRISLEEAVIEVQKNTRHYAKRQLTWFRRYDKIDWYDITLNGGGETALAGYIPWLKKKL